MIFSKARFRISSIQKIARKVIFEICDIVKCCLLFEVYCCCCWMRSTFLLVTLYSLSLSLSLWVCSCVCAFMRVCMCYILFVIVCCILSGFYSCKQFLNFYVDFYHFYLLVLVFLFKQKLLWLHHFSSCIILLRPCSFFIFLVLLFSAVTVYIGLLHTALIIS